MSEQRTPTPEYFLALELLRGTLLDALDGGGPEQLQWLFSDLGQAAIRALLNCDADAAREATERTVRRLERAVATGQARRIRHLIAWDAWQKLLAVWEAL